MHSSSKSYASSTSAFLRKQAAIASKQKIPASHKIPPIPETNIEVILPLAYEYQVDGLLKRCNEYLMQAKLPFMDKILIADRFGLEDLVTWCLAGSQGVTHVNIATPQYSLLSDRTKVRLLESMQGASAVGFKVFWSKVAA